MHCEPPDGSKTARSTEYTAFRRRARPELHLVRRKPARSVLGPDDGYGRLGIDGHGGGAREQHRCGGSLFFPQPDDFLREGARHPGRCADVGQGEKQHPCETCYQ